MWVPTPHCVSEAVFPGLQLPYLQHGNNLPCPQMDSEIMESLKKFQAADCQVLFSDLMLSCCVTSDKYLLYLYFSFKNEEVGCCGLEVLSAWTFEDFFFKHLWSFLNYE